MTRLTLTCQAVLFDLDGVLVDSRAVVERTWQRWAERRGMPAHEIARRAHGRRTIDSVREFAPDLDAVSEARWLESVEVSDVEGLIALPGAASLYHALSDARRAVVTSGGRELATTRLRATGFELPALLITAEDIERGKPAPDGYLLAATRLGVAPSACVVIEDAPAGVAAGQAAAAIVLAVTTTFPYAELRAADVTARSLEAVHVSLEADMIHLEVYGIPNVR